MTIGHFLKYEVDDWDADSNYIYLKLDKEKYYFPVMPTNKSELRLWAILNFAPFGDDFEDLRVELEKNSKELEVYKKALGLACNIIEEHAYCPYMCDGNRRCIDCLLQKARGQE